VNSGSAIGHASSPPQLGTSARPVPTTVAAGSMAAPGRPSAGLLSPWQAA
jgi:hypothetical protein